MKVNYILYNPISRNGKNITSVNKLAKKLVKSGEKVFQHNLLEIIDVSQFIKEVPSDARCIIVGGDGTLNILVNQIRNIDVPQEIYMYRAGTGNDFMRSIPGRGKLKNIKKYLQKLPTVEYNDQKRLYLNSAGLGMDALICSYVNKSTKKKSKWNYFRSVFRAIAHARFTQATIIVDGVVHKEDRLWACTVMNSKYLGGGMKAIPRASREDKHLSVLLVKNIKKWQMIFVFPTIYFGIHTIFKKTVSIITGNEISLEFQNTSPLQVDGEVVEGINRITVIKK